MGQQRDHQVEGARRLVVGVAQGEYASEPGLLARHPGEKPRGRHLVLDSLLLSHAPRILQRSIRKVRSVDRLLELLRRETTQSEPRLDGVGTVVQLPMGRGNRLSQSSHKSENS